MNKITITKSEDGQTVFRDMVMDAIDQNLFSLQSEIESILQAAGCPMKTRWQIRVAVEEIFVNIAHYAYEPEKGKATIRVETSEEHSCAVLVFEDRGIPYNPLAKKDPDITLSAKERKIGGLGIFMTKKLMDEVSYVYDDGRNILTLKKTW